MVVYFGLNDKIGNVSYYDSTGQQEYSFVKPYSEKTAQLIDEEVSLLIENAYNRAIKIIKDNKEKVEKLAQVLLEKEVIFREDLIKIFGDRPFEERRKKLDEDAEEEVKLLKKNNGKNKVKPLPKENENDKKEDENKNSEIDDKPDTKSKD